MEKKFSQNREQEENEKNIPRILKPEGNEKIHSHTSGREQESEAIITGNSWEQEWKEKQNYMIVEKKHPPT